MLLDSDSDGISDGLEDTDRDGLSNQDEVGLGTDPANPDTDGDGTLDGQEIISGCSPLVPEITKVVGRAIGEQGSPILGALVRTLDRTGKTDPQGTFTILNVPTCPLRVIRVMAIIYQEGIRLQGLSIPTQPALGGITNVGDIILKPTSSALYPGNKIPLGSFSFIPSIAIADLNVDGISDIVTANFSNNDISVLLGRGDTTFQAQQRFVVGSSPQSMAVADLNADRIPDIITANLFSNDISVLIGNGDGTFKAQQRFSVGSFPTSVAMADLNLDGIPDLATANSGSNDVSLLLHQ